MAISCNCREAEDEKKQRAEIERRRKEEEALVAKYLEAERIKADEVCVSAASLASVAFALIRAWMKH